MNLNFLKPLESIFLAFLLLELSTRRVTNYANVSCIEKERQALLEFKHSLVDESGLLSTWGSGDCCHWNGVECSPQTGHIEKLDLHGDYILGRHLQGKINPSLIEMQHLKYLSLSDNNFNWTEIPVFFGCLSNLEHLDLSHAYFGGIIPNELGNLSNLQVLDLSANSFVGVIPYQLENLSNLQVLDLSANSLVGVIPYQLGNLSSLQVLDLGANSFVGVIPYQLGNLSGLRKLYLDNNNLAGVFPHQLGNLSSLQILCLGGNGALTIDGNGQAAAGWLSNLPSLTHLDLHSLSNLNNCNNSLQVVSKLPNLSQLSLANCSLTDNNLLHLTFSKSLAILDLGLNNFTLSIFSWLFNLSSKLVELNLNHNNLLGPIPNDFGRFMESTVFLDLSNNYLNGIISDIHFENLTKLKKLDLSLNSLTVKFSHDWVPPFQLQRLYLKYCKMTTFPNWLQTQNDLWDLDIRHAGILDSIPQWFWNLSTRLHVLDLSYNNLSGDIPDLPIKFANYSTIVLAHNQMEGPIPPFLLTARELDLSYNKFSSLSSLCATIKTGLESLMKLDVSNNKLLGHLPDCWNNLKSLMILDLSNNNISGNIPASMGNLAQIYQLFLRNNNLSGELDSLKNNTQLVLLDLGENEFSGNVPSWIGDRCQLLEMLSLRSNRFYGSLPKNLCLLRNIQVLDLSQNNISGELPRCLGNFIAMAQKTNSSTTRNKLQFYQDGKRVDILHLNVELFVVWKGQLLAFRNKYRLLRIIDLSSNQIMGDIPSEIGNLLELVSLNLSRNNLCGEITSELGKLSSLNALDLSRNHFTGRIPTSLSKISFLSVLDLSNNNLSGKIPIGTQLQSFDASAYEGNPYLCGCPIEKLCPGDESFHQGNEGDNQDNRDSLFSQGFYLSLGLGFTTGFWAVLGPLLFIPSWRYAYFNF